LGHEVGGLQAVRSEGRHRDRLRRGTVPWPTPLVVCRGDRRRLLAGV